MTQQTENKDGSLKTDHSSEESCIFCKIVQGSIQAVKVCEDSETVAFLDIGPVNNGHVLVIPKEHYENVYSVPVETWCRIMMTVQKVAISVKNAMDADGVNIIVNNESAAGQIVFHSHAHVIPRFNEDGLRHWPHQTYKDAEEMSLVADKIRTALEM